MQYNKDINDCQFSGSICDTPTLSYKQHKHNPDQSYPFLSFTLQLKHGSNYLIPCVALGNLALKLNAIISHSDVVFVKSSFNPILIDNTFKHRFLISFLAILQKDISPIQLSYSQDLDSLSLLHYIE